MSDVKRAQAFRRGPLKVSGQVHEGGICIVSIVPVLKPFTKARVISIDAHPPRCIILSSPAHAALLQQYSICSAAQTSHAVHQQHRCTFRSGMP